MRSTRGLYIDMLDGEEGPKRGDRLRSPKTLYWVIHSRRVKRRDLNAVPRYQMRVLTNDEIDKDFKGRLLRSALRRNSGSRLFTFEWYPRKKKSASFEQYIRRR
jgi:hypothetical protein